MSHLKKSWNVPIAGMWDTAWTDSGKRFRKKHRKAKTTKQGRKGKTPVTARNEFDLASDSSSKGSVPATLGENDTAKESVMSLFTALASLDISPTEESFDIETDTDSNFSLHGETPRLGCSSPTWTTEDVQVLETFLDWSHESSLSKRDAIYISSYERPSLSAFAPQQPDSPFLSHQDNEQIALESCHFVQTFNEGSFIARSTQVTTSVRTSGDADLGLISEVTVTAGADIKSPSRPRSSGAQSQSSFRALISRSGRSPAVLSTQTRAPSPNVSLRGDIAETWKPPTAWDCALTTEASLSEVEDVIDEATVDEDLLTNLPTMKQEENRVATKGASFGLFRLRRSRSNLKGSSLCEEVEEERIDWTKVPP